MWVGYYYQHTKAYIYTQYVYPFVCVCLCVLVCACVCVCVYVCVYPPLLSYLCSLRKCPCTIYSLLMEEPCVCVCVCVLRVFVSVC